MQERAKKYKNRKSAKISALGKPSRGAEGVRRDHRLHEDKILAHRRCGIKDADIDIALNQFSCQRK